MTVANLGVNYKDAGRLVDALPRHVVRRLRSSGPVLRPRERRGEIRVVGGYYNLHTGVVEWLAI